MVTEILVEIGTEEIPSGYLSPGLNSLKESVEACLKDNRIQLAGGIYTFGTPRRLVLIGKAIAEQQEDLVQEVTGPPKKVAYDGNGNPTKAALGFAERQGVSVEDLQCIETPKGEYLHVKTCLKGRDTRDILAEALPVLISKIPWPKSMRWGKVNVPFVRPVHWVLAIMNGEVIPFEFAGVASGNVTFGHRFLKPEPMQIFSVQGYFEAMKEGFVIIDQREREDRVIRETRETASAMAGLPVEDPDLVSTVANLVEYPFAVCGSFDSKFLMLPEPVLITVMKKHQKYFAVYDAEGRLTSHFVAVNNTRTADDAVVAKGHERVLRARLADADFFFGEDRKRPLLSRLEDLKGVVYQADMGTSHAKVMRFTRLADYLARTVLPDKSEAVQSAARLAKCDLVTHMVSEFPELQGVMGEVYARDEKYPDEVCLAVREHYLPSRAEGPLPTSTVGAVVSLADRMDTICGCFAVGLVPTGNTDPFALRRHALAIIRTIEAMEWRISLNEFIEKSLSILGEELKFDVQTVREGVQEFFRERYRHMLLRSDYASDPIQAILSVSIDNLCDLRARIDQLSGFSQKAEEFPALIATSKRISNILKSQEEAFEVSPERFLEDCESALWKVFLGTQKDVNRCLEKGAYEEALNHLVRLREPVDHFFEGVEILTKKDESLRENRVGVLQCLSRLFLSVADFSKFSV